ncbi:MAG: hypothetical protein AB1742_01510 [bacterium]
MTTEEKERTLAAKLGDYVDGAIPRLDPSDPETLELMPEIETVLILRLALGETPAPDAAFSRRLRAELVAGAASRARRARRRALALAASLLLLLLPALFALRASFAPESPTASHRRPPLAGKPRPFAARYSIRPFAPALEEKMNRMQNKWMEARMERDYERFVTERGRTL